MTKITETETALWKMLDDISTAGDAFKPEDSPFARYVLKKCEEREKYIVSDGYELFLPEYYPEQNVSKVSPEGYVQ